MKISPSFFGRYHPLAFLILLSLFSTGQAEEKKIYIGVERNKVPYTYFNSEREMTGIIAEEVKELCLLVSANCNFVTGEVNNLLADLRAFKLHAVIVLDAFILPEIDEVKFSHPLCKIKPVFVQKVNDSKKKEIADFKGTTIGVQQGSLLHIYLLENYSSTAQLKPYTQLENAVFDLLSGRINSLFTDSAFYKDRIEKTTFSHKDNPSRLIAFSVGTPEIPETSMSLAFRKNNKELLQRIKTLQSPFAPTCESLL